MLATVLAAIPGFAQTGGTGSTGGTNGALFCTIPLVPTGTTNAQSFGELTCGAPLNTINVQFAAEGAIPLNFVLASPQPLLPADIFSGLQLGTLEARQFVKFVGSVLTVDLSIVPAGAVIPTPATATLPPGTLLTEIRIQVQNATVTDSSPQTILFSGIVLASSSNGGSGTGSTGTTGTPMLPGLFGDPSGRAATVSLAFNNPITFPGLGSTPAGEGSGTGTITGTTGGMFNGGDGAAAPATMIGVAVAGSFALASPSGFVALSFPTGGGGSTGGGGGGGANGPEIVFAPFAAVTNSRQIQLDASQTSVGSGPVTYLWKSTGVNVAGILNADTATPIIQFLGIGPYQISLTVTNAAGQSSTATVTMQYNGGS
jgi:hypothetical protein